MFHCRLFAIALCCLALPACGWIKDAGVAVFGDELLGDDPRIQALTEFKPRLKPEKVWSSSVGAGAEDSYAKLLPLVQGGAVFAGGPKGRVGAFSARSGKRLWKRSLNVPVSFAVGGGGRTLMVGTITGEVIAFAANSGDEIWRRRFSGDEITAISRPHRSLVLVRDSGGRVIAVAVEDGEKLWQFKTDLPTLTLRGMSVPRLHEGFGFVGLDSGKLLIVALENGRVQRELRIGLTTRGSDLESIVDIDGRFRIYDDVLYVAAYRGRVLALDIEAQRVLWLAKFESYAGLDVDEEFVYLVGTGGEVRALDRFTGTEIWDNPAFAVRTLSAPLATGKFVLVGDNLGYLYWLARDDGAILARRRVMRAPIASAPLAWRDQVLVLGRGSDLASAKIAARLAARSR